VQDEGLFRSPFQQVQSPQQPTHAWKLQHDDTLVFFREHGLSHELLRLKGSLNPNQERLMTVANLLVRPFDTADLPSLMLLEQSSVSPRAERRSRKHFKFMLNSVNELIMVAVLDDQIVGYIGYSMPRRPFCPKLGLHRIVVNKELRRRGIGQALLNAVLALRNSDFCNGVSCNGVPVKDEASQKFLYKNGFEDAGALSHQYIYRSMDRRNETGT
jgi:ribosomal protein S18 acetylase RimI-like enzyme